MMSIWIMLLGSTLLTALVPTLRALVTRCLLRQSIAAKAPMKDTMTLTEPTTTPGCDVEPDVVGRARS